MAKSHRKSTGSTSQHHLYKTKPTYRKLIIQALQNSPASARKGTSRQYIHNYITSKYQTPEDSIVSRYLSKRLREMKDEGDLVMVRRSYRFSPAMRKRVKKQGMAASRRLKKQQKTSSSTRRTKRTRAAKRRISTSSEDLAAPPALFTSTGNSRFTSASSSETEPESGFIWQYYHNGFHNYDVEASEQVEQVYQNYLSDPRDCDVRRVQSGHEGFHYMIDFRNWTQQNIDHPNHTVRRIRRVRWNEAS